MKIIDRYIGRQLLTSAFFGVLVLSIILVLGRAFKDLLQELVSRPDLDISFLGGFLFNVFLFSLSLTIPWGFLTAILLIFGRISADNELISLRMAGMSMPRICMSTIVLGLVFTLFCLWMNVTVSPAAKNRLVNMAPDMLFNMAMENPLSLFRDGEVMEEIPRHRIYLEKNEDGTVRNIQIVKLDDTLRPELFVIAKHGTISASGGDSPEIRMDLYDARFELKSEEDSRKFTEAQPYSAKFAPLAIPLDRLKERQDRLRPDTLPFGELFSMLSHDEDISRKRKTSLRTEISLRLSLSLACVTLGLIGIPLGITAQRRETSIGFAISLIVGLIYFLFILIAGITRENAKVHPYLLAWLPNIIFLVIGGLLFRRVCRR